MATTIIQEPLYRHQMGADDFLCTVQNDAIVSGVPTAYFNVKFIAEVFIGEDTINTGTSAQLVGTFKVIPNNKGRGIFNFKQVIESYVTPQHQGYEDLAAAPIYPPSDYKGVGYDLLAHPIHLIDKFACNREMLRYIKVQFKLEGATFLGGPVSVISNTSINSSEFLITNSYVPVDGTYITGGTGNSKYSWIDTKEYQQTGATVPPTLGGSYLTNVPLVQEVNYADYGTISFLTSTQEFGSVQYVQVRWYNASNVLQGSTNTQLNFANGGVFPNQSHTATKLFFFGSGPANLSNANASFKTDLDNGVIAYYTLQNLQSLTQGQEASRQYRFNVTCSPFRGFEPIRLCWLNQMGSWDYYTFNKKSTRKLTSKKTKYQQLSGTWNGDFYERMGWKGGGKTYRSNTTETIKMNTGYITEDWAVLFEEMINSPEVYRLQPQSRNNPNQAYLNKYVHPCVLKTSSYTRKTKANDRLINYSFEIEMSKIQNVQNA
jgi:hypothetical protein